MLHSMRYKEEIEMKKYFTPFATVLTLTKEDILTVSGSPMDSIPTARDTNEDFGGFISFD